MVSVLIGNSIYKTHGFVYTQIIYRLKKEELSALATVLLICLYYLAIVAFVCVV